MELAGDWKGSLFTSIFFSYTRSLIIPAMMLVTIMLVYTAFRGEILKGLKRLFLVIGIGLSASTFILFYFPSNLEYVVYRLQGLSRDSDF